MNIIYHILRLFAVLLFSVFGTSMAFAVPVAASKITYSQPEIIHFTQVGNVGFAARAPPSAATNVTITGGGTAIYGSAFALHGQEQVAALFGFGGSSNAPKRGKVTIQDGAKPDQNELRAGEGLENKGKDVEHRATVGDLGVSGQRTSDLFVDGKPFDVYTPAAGSNTNKIVTNIEKKAKQGNVLVQGDFSAAQMDEIAARTFGKGKQNTVYFQNSAGDIFEFNKN